MKDIKIESIDHMLGIASQFIINSTTTSFDAQMDTLNSDCNDYTRKLNTLQNSAENLVDPNAVASQLSEANKAVEAMQEKSMRYVLLQLSDWLSTTNGLDGVHFELPNAIKAQMKTLVSNAFNDMESATKAAKEKVDALSPVIDDVFARSYNKAPVTLNFNTSAGITEKNFSQCLNDPTPEQKEWAVAAVNDMFRSFYGEERFNHLLREGVDLTEGIKLGNTSAKAAYNTQDYSDFCCKFVKDMLGKERSFQINPMVKGSNGEYQPADLSCAIEPKEKHIPWWKKLFNLLFGKKKEANQKVGFDALVSEEQASDIFDIDTEIKDYTDKARPFLDRDNEHSEFIKKIDMYALGPYTNNEPNEFFKKNSGIVSSMDRTPSRVSLIMGNMLNDGFTYEDLLEPNENTINHLKEVGKRFLDTMVATNEKVVAASLDADFESKSAEEQKAYLESEEFQAAYAQNKQAQIEKSAGFFQNAANGLVKLEESAKDIHFDVTKIEGISTKGFFKVFDAGVMRLDLKQDTNAITLPAFTEIKSIVGNSEALDKYTSILNLRERMVSGHVTNALVSSQEKFASEIVNILNNKMLLAHPEISEGKSKERVDAEMMIAAEITLNSICHDPAKLKYATLLATGTTPLPDNFIKINGSMFEYNFDECFEQHKQLNSAKTKKPTERAIGK